jgi:hypothetical protein
VAHPLDRELPGLGYREVAVEDEADQEVEGRRLVVEVADAGEMRRLAPVEAEATALHLDLRAVWCGDIVTSV